MPKFRKKPVVVEAIQWDGTNTDEVLGLCGGDSAQRNKATLLIDTLEGRMIASRGDWIIKGVAGEVYPCKPDIFAATYDPA